MHIHSITKILKNIFFRKDLGILDLKLMSEAEKDSFTEYVSKCRIESFFLNQLGPDLISQSLGERNFFKLKNNGKVRAIRTLENLRFAKKIDKELNLQDIDHVFLKGINMHKYFYQNDPSLRPLSDIDILVKKENVIEVINICKNLGFDVSKWSSIKEEGLELYRNPNPFHKNGQAQVDIHTPFKSSIFYKEDNFYFFAKDLLKTKKNYCEIEDVFINCVFHGTRHSIYNVGPIFILDLIKLIKDSNIDWKEVSKKIKKYGLQKDTGYIFKYFENKITYSRELDVFTKSTDFNEDDLNLIFLAEPKNSSVFSVYTLDGIKVLAKKIFSKKYIKDHNFQKFTFFDFLQNLLYLIKKHLVPVKKLNGEMTISKLRFKLLRRK